MQRVPTLDMRRFAVDRRGFVDELGEAYRQYGFCCFSHHGIEPTRIEAAYAGFRRFFDLPECAKQRYGGRAGGRGYVGFKVETARTSDVPDLKEFFHVGREVEGDGPLPPAAAWSPNAWPDEVPGLREHALALYASMERAGDVVLSAMALHLGLTSDFFAGLTARGNSILRALHYPPVRFEDLPAVRAEAHEDISLITLLISATEAGLEVLARDGAWLPVETLPGGLVVNVGDMMQRLTNRVYPSTTHRVVNPSGNAARNSRYAMPFFLHLDPEYEIRSLPGCVLSERIDHYPEPITVQAFLAQRLREIRLG